MKKRCYILRKLSAETFAWLNSVRGVIVPCKESRNPKCGRPVSKGHHLKQMLVRFINNGNYFQAGPWNCGSTSPNLRPALRDNSSDPNKQ